MTNEGAKSAEGHEETLQHEPKDIQIATFNPRSPASTKHAIPLIFSHGAGGTMYTDAVANFRDGFVSNGNTCITFNGTMHLGSRVKAFRAVREHASSKISNGEPTALGGRSMGARAAVLTATEMLDSGNVTKDIVLVSYPLTNEKGDVRDQILLDIDKNCRVIFVSGDRDSMCDLQGLNEVRGKMACSTWMVTVVGADHGMNVKPKSATRDMTVMTGKVVAQWLGQRDENATEGQIMFDADENNAVWSGWSAGGKDAAKSTSSAKKQPAKESKSKVNGKSAKDNGKKIANASSASTTPQKKRKARAQEDQLNRDTSPRRSTRLRGKTTNSD